MTKPDPFKYFLSSPEIIRLAAMMYSAESPSAIIAELRGVEAEIGEGLDRLEQMLR